MDRCGLRLLRREQLFEMGIDRDAIFFEKSGSLRRLRAPELLRLGSWRRSLFGLTLGIERLGGQLAVGLFEQNFDFAFGFFELLLAFARKLDAFFESFIASSRESCGDSSRRTTSSSRPSDFSKSGFFAGSGFLIGVVFKVASRVSIKNGACSTPTKSKLKNRGSMF